MGFNDSTWGDTTHDYAKAMSNLSDKKFKAIVEEAEKYASIKQNYAHKLRTKATKVIEIDNKHEWACLVSEDENEDDQCKSFFNFYNLTNMII